MHYFPICLDINKKKCVVIGGGKVAERKVVMLLESGGRVSVVSPVVSEKLHDLYKNGLIHWRQGKYSREDIEDAFLVIAATDSSTVQEKVYSDAVEKNTLINVADVPEKCNFILPATARRGSLTISVSTSGKSPAMARKIRQDLEENFGPEYEILVNILGELRPRILAMQKSQQENEILFRGLLHDDLLDWIRQENRQRIKEYFSELLGQPIEFKCLI